jgi:tetratricopeptide (TPR) repeat protein
MSDQWTDRLSDYLDGELNPAERGALETHLATCAACTATLAELERVVARARALEDRAPAADLWAGVAAKIGVGTGAVVDIGSARARRARRVTFSVPQLIAASVAWVLLSGGGMWLALRSDGPGSVEMVSESGGAGVVTVDWAAGGGGAQAAARYDRAIGQLEQALAAGRGRLDSATIRVLEISLGRIDRAIDEARRALADDPASTYLNDHLTRTMRRKLELLRQAAWLTRAES